MVVTGRVQYKAGGYPAPTYNGDTTSLASLGRKFKATWQCIQGIVNRKTYKYVP